MKTRFASLLVITFLIFCMCGGKSATKDVKQNTKNVESQKVIQEIEKFYTSYATHIMKMQDAANDSILQLYCTDRLLSKIGRMKLATQSDPIIRSQDFSKSSISTLQVKHLKNNWYMVNYTQSFDNKQIRIPIRIMHNKRIMIDYITPEWNDSLYGDSLFFEKPIPVAIDDSTPLSLLKTFYDAYTMEYCSMPSDLISRLETLRKKYLTTNALTQFKSVININDMNYLFGYDLLIDYYDFDRLWIPSIKFIHLDNNTYQMQYTKWENNTTTITLSVVKQNNKYKINDIKREK
jgi:hypothetical protein